MNDSPVADGFQVALSSSWIHVARERTSSPTCSFTLSATASWESVADGLNNISNNERPQGHKKLRRHPSSDQLEARAV